MGSAPAQIPTCVGHELRACLRCRLVKTCDQSRESGCENCLFFKMDEDHERVVDCTTPNFNGTPMAEQNPQDPGQAPPQPPPECPFVVGSSSSIDGNQGLGSYNLASFNLGMSLQLSSIKTLTGSNFDDWFESLSMFLRVMNLDLALRVDPPLAPTPMSSAEERNYYNFWEHSNRNCLMIMKYTIDKPIRGSFPHADNARDFMEAIKKQFVKFDKVEISNYMRLFTTTKYDGTSGVREHILKMTNYCNKLREKKVEVGDQFLVWQILESLPSQFDNMRSSYNTQKDVWDLNTMTTIVIQEEEIIKARRSSHSALMVSQANVTGKKKFGKIGPSKKFKSPFKKKVIDFPPKASSTTTSFESKSQNSDEFKGVCLFCHKYGHQRANCKKFAKWKVKKGLQWQSKILKILAKHHHSSLQNVPLWLAAAPAVVGIRFRFLQLRIISVMDLTRSWAARWLRIDLSLVVTFLQFRRHFQGTCRHYVKKCVCSMCHQNEYERESG